MKIKHQQIFKIITLLILLLTFNNNCFSQESKEDSDFKKWNEVEVKPDFPTGIGEFYKFIGKNFKIPQEASKNKIRGKVYIRLIIEKDGSFSNYQIIRDLGYGLGDESIRVLKLSPNWKPGTINGEPVRVEYNLPITVDAK